MNETGKKKIILTAVIALAAVALILLLVVYLASGGALFNRGTRTVLSKSALGGAPDFSYESGIEQTYAALGDGLIVANTVGYTYYGSGGKPVCSETVITQRPTVDENGKYALIYDLGGTHMRLVSEDGKKTACEAEGEILFAYAGEGGYFAVGTKESGYKGAVTVYRPDGTAIYKWYSGEGYLTSAQTSDKGRKLYVSVLTGEGSRIMMFDTSDTDEKMRCDIPGELVISAAPAVNGGAVAVADDAVFSVSDSGQLKELYRYDGKTLLCTARGEGYTALALSTSAAQADGTVVTVTDTGTVKEGESGSAPTYMSASGRYIAVLTSGGAAVFDKTAKNVAVIEERRGAEAVLMRRSGSVLIVTSHQANAYSV